MGRVDEVAALCAVLDSVAAGRGQSIFVVGEAGIGKTHLLNKICNEAQARGFAVYAGGGDELERDRAFRAIAEALRPQAGEGGDAQAVADLMAPDPDFKGPGLLLAETPDLSYRIIEAILDLLDDAASRGPVLVAIEDLHWIDAASLRTIWAIASRLAHLPIALIGTARPHPWGDDLRRVSHAMAARHAPMIVGPLGSDDIDVLVGGLLGGRVGERLRLFLSGCGGNPLYVLELARSLRDEGSISMEDGVADIGGVTLPPTLRMTLLRRASLLSQPTLEVLRLATILGSTFDPGDLSTVSGRSVADLLGSLGEAIDAGLVVESGERLGFRHDIIRDAIYEDMPLAVRAALHREAAPALAAAGARPESVAEHYILGATAGDKEAADALRRAAWGVAPRSQASAARLLEHALEIAGPTHPDRDLIAADLIQIRFRTGRLDEARALADQLLASGPGPMAEATARVGIALGLTFMGDMSAAAEQLEFAATAEWLPEAFQASMLASAAHLLVIAGEAGRGEELARRALDVGERLGSPLVLCLSHQALAQAADARGMMDDALAHARKAVAAEDGAPPGTRILVPSRMTFAMILLDADRLDQAEAFLREGHRATEASGVLSWLVFFHWLMAEHRFIEGAWDDSIADARAGLALADETDNRASMLALRVVLARVLIHRGDLREAARLVSDAERDCPPIDADAGWAALGRGTLQEAQGDDAAALASLMRAWRLLAPLRFFLIGRSLGPAIVRLAMRCSDRDVAESVVGEMERCPAVESVASARGAALVCAGLARNDPDLLAAAVNAYRQSPRVLDVALACEDAAPALAAAGRRDEAEAMLREAAALFTNLGATRDLARIEAAHRTLGIPLRRRGRPRRPPAAGWPSLTDTERKVITLVAQGRTNRQAGEALFVSPRTIEAHLSQVFRKLGISTRVELAAEAARRSE